MQVWSITVIGRCGLLRQVIDMIAGLCPDWAVCRGRLTGRLSLVGHGEIAWAKRRAMTRGRGPASERLWGK